jgi:hypothetical protein
MNPKVKAQIENVITALPSSNYNRINQEIATETGKEKVINMIYNRITQHENFSFENALADVEFNLKKLENE